jgi:hypothetical protein
MSLFFRRDPGPCPVDDAPHTICCAPTSDGAIVAGPITPATSITIPGPTRANAPPAAALPPSPPAPSLAPEPTATTTATYRGRKTSPPSTGG